MFTPVILAVFPEIVTLAKVNLKLVINFLD